jgi:hypothetical protein
MEATQAPEITPSLVAVALIAAAGPVKGRCIMQLLKDGIRK